MSSHETNQLDLMQLNLTQLQKRSELIDTIGDQLANELVKVRNFGEAQLRKIHSELIRLNRMASTLRAYTADVPQGKIAELKRGVVKLSYIITYQHAKQKERYGSSKADAVDKYFGFMKKMVTQLKDSQDLPNDIEVVFNVSESIIAYYNYFDQIEKEKRRERHG